MSLTAKQEAFAQSIASGKSQADAYRAAYQSDAMKAETVQNSAYKLMQNGEITARIEELRKPVVEAAQITLASHLERLQALSDAAERSNQFSAAISAEVARGKASGLYVDRVEQTGINGGPIDMNMTLKFVKPE